MGTTVAFVALTFKYDVHSTIYGATDTVCRVVSLTAATGFVIDVLGPKRVLLLYLFPAIPFWFTFGPFYSESYYVKLAAIMGTSYAILGAAILCARQSGYVRSLGIMWLSISVWHFGFAGWIDRYMMVWKMNDWLPSAISVIGLAIVGWQLRKQ